MNNDVPQACASKEENAKRCFPRKSKLNTMSHTRLSAPEHRAHLLTKSRITAERTQLTSALLFAPASSTPSSLGEPSFSSPARCRSADMTNLARAYEHQQRFRHIENRVGVQVGLPSFCWMLAVRLICLNKRALMASRCVRARKSTVQTFQNSINLQFPPYHCHKKSGTGLFTRKLPERIRERLTF